MPGGGLGDGWCGAAARRRKLRATLAKLANPNVNARRLEPFRHVVNDPRFRPTPMILETPKGREGADELDALNYQALRRLERERPC